MHFVYLLSLVCTSFVLACARQAPKDNPIADAGRLGLIEGTMQKTIDEGTEYMEFRGIPYSHQTVDTGRFQVSKRKHIADL